MTNRVTMERTTCWNSSSTPVISLERFHAAARPTRIEKNRADITGMIWGIVSSNTTPGNSFRPSTSGLIFKCGKIPNPAAVAKNAAPIEETYARINATISILEALLPNLVIDGAMKPMIISGTQKLINCPAMNFTVTTMFNSALPIPL